MTHLPAFAGLDADQKKGLEQTKTFLKNKGERQKEIDKDPKAKDIDNKVDALAGTPENKEEMYDLASQLVEKIALEANGDADKMQRMLMEAQKNPKAFYEKYFDESQKSKVRGLATKIEGGSTGSAPK